MATGQGTALVDFGAFPGSNEGSVAVTGQASISATSKAEAYIMADDTSANYTAADTKYLALFCALSCGTPSAGVGFTIYGRSYETLQGLIPVRYVWAD